MIKPSASEWQVTCYLFSIVPGHSLKYHTLPQTIQHALLDLCCSSASKAFFSSTWSSSVPLYEAFPGHCPETGTPSAVFSQPLCQTSHMQHGIVTTIYFPFPHTSENSLNVETLFYSVYIPNLVPATQKGLKIR